MRTTVAVALLVITCSMAVMAQAAGPWSMILPDPDEVDWTSNNRPGYRYRGMEPLHERFYKYIQTKRERGEELSMADNAMIRRLQAARRWPEAPRPNEFWMSFLRYLREQPNAELNFAQSFMLSEAMARGLIHVDLTPSQDARRAMEYLSSGPFRARNWFERCFGRVEPWMDYYLASGGVDMRDGGGAGGTAFPPGGDFNGMRIHYNVSGIALGEYEDRDSFTTTRTYKGTIAPGRVTISGSAAMNKGWDATLRVYIRAGNASADEEWTIKAPGSQDFSVSIDVPPDADLSFPSPQFFIRLNGRFSTAGAGSTQVGRGLQVAGYLEEDPAARQARHERADAEWREQVERTLRELGYEQTPAGRELEEMRKAIAGGDDAWRAYVDRKQRELGYQDAGPEAGFDELSAALETGGPVWQQYASAHGGGLPPAPEDIGGLQVGTGTDAGTTTGAADHFPQASKIAAAMTYQNQQPGSVAVAVWTRDGQEVTRSQQTLGGANGWVSFSLFTDDAGGLQPGRYTLTISVGDTILGRKTFTIGGGVG